jgi:hypothetical protein
VVERIHQPLRAHGLLVQDGRVRVEGALQRGGALAPTGAADARRLAGADVVRAGAALPGPLGQEARELLAVLGQRRVDLGI